MSKRLEEMTEQELLIEIARGQQKEARHSRISAAAIIVLVVAFVVTILVYNYRTAEALKRVYATMNEAGELMVSAQDSLEEIDEMVENLNAVIVDNTDSVNTALKQIGDFDVESLNKSIEELATILNPLARLLGGGRN